VPAEVLVVVEVDGLVVVVDVSVLVVVVVDGLVVDTVVLGVEDATGGVEVVVVFVELHPVTITAIMSSNETETKKSLFTFSS
jgi:hypothetical protein